MRPALLFETQTHPLPKTVEEPSSLFGSVTHCSEEEEWPTQEGVPLCPLLQLNLENTPYRPPGTEDIRFLTLFVHSNRYPVGKAEAPSWCLRTYSSTRNLVSLQQPNYDWPIRKTPLSVALLVEDYPCTEELNCEVEDEICPKFRAQHPNQKGVKVGGWPHLLHSQLGWEPPAENPACPRYVFQVEISPESGRNGSLQEYAYLGRGTTRGHKDTWALEWHCL